MQLDSSHLEAAAHKATAWLAAQMTQMGNYRGREPRGDDGVYPDTDDIGCYYKSIYALRATGQSAAAARGMGYVVQRFRSDAGDFYNTPTVRSSGSYGPYFCQMYQNSWLMRGASALHWFGLARDILRFMNTQRDPQSGGYFSHVNTQTGIMDSNSVAVGAYCCILGGQVEMARQSCDLLVRLLGAQRDPGILWSRCRRDGTLVTDLDGVEKKNWRYVRIAADEPEQAYWIWAWPMNALIAAHEMTDEPRYLDAAVRIFDFLASCHPHAFGFTTSGKNAWGAAKLYRLTGERRYLDKSLLQMQYILDHQHAEGYMLGEGVQDESGQPRRTTFDYTADFASWLIDNAAEFASKGL
ncbi:MAG: beta-L-arabinofuranosidase domain-containing protein [Candidatus Latescibacterota bacterium]